MNSVRPPSASDEERWRELWRGYLAFYRQDLASSVTAATWDRMLQPGSGIIGRLAEVDGCVQGFAIAVLHPGTWTTRPICYLEDLYVDPVSRGAGLGRALIEHVLALAEEQGWSRVYWHTEAGNATARALYDRFAAADGFVRYRVVVP